MSKTNKNSKLKYILQDTWPALLRIVKIPRNKERLRNCHRPEEIKEMLKRIMETLQPHTVCGILDPRTRTRKRIVVGKPEKCE